ncbi:unnamed protein product [Leuciscus chuanchicus]
MPVEYQLELRGHTIMYVPILQMIQELFKNTELMELWPALKMESEVYAEFQRITNQNLHNTFYSELDRHLPRLMTLFRQKAGRTGKTSDALTEILKIHDAQEFHDIHTKRVTVLQPSCVST